MPTSQGTDAQEWRLRVRLIILRQPPTANIWVGKGTRWLYYSIKKSWLREFVPASGRPKPRGPVRLDIIRVLGRRERAYDIDNFVGGLKPIIDALRRHRYIRDDNPFDLELRAVQRREIRSSLAPPAVSGPAVVIEVWEGLEPPGPHKDPTASPRRRHLRS